MKKFWISVGKAVLYFGAYFGAQFAISFVVSLIISVIISVSMIQPDGSIDMTAYMDKANAVLGEAMYYILIISGLLTILIFWIVAKIRKKKFVKSAALNKLKPATIAPILIGGIAFNFAISYLMGIIPFPQSWIDSYQASSSEVLGGAGIAMWISVVVMAPLVEELTFRGFIYTRLKQGMAKWVAAILTSLIFGIVHGTIIWAMYTFVFSLCLLYIFERTNSLWGCILFHMAFNFVGAVMSTWPEFGEKLDGWVILTGSIAVSVAAAVWLIMVSKKDKDDVVEEEINNTQIEEKQMMNEM